VTRTTTKPSTDTKTEAAAGTRPPTRWGDREGRRRDILAAARDQMEAGGYLALNMRDIAAGAGVSPGTLYSYFATKEAIFATLYAEAIAAHTDRIRPVCDAPPGLEDTIVELTVAHLDLYTRYGRYFTQWSSVVAERAAADDPLPPELSAALRAATVEQAALVRLGLERAADAEGRAIREPGIAMSLLWAMQTGIGDHVTSQRRKLTPVTTEELVRYAARTLAVGMTEPSGEPDLDH
jgi:AcrR family transcriptional regulator